MIDMNMERTAMRFIKRLETAYSLRITADQKQQLRGEILSMISNAMVAKRDRSCVGKMRYATKQDAHQAYVALYATDPHMQFYKCQFCLGWHMGHSNG